MKLHWKKGLFSSSHKVFEQNKQVGKLTEKAFSNRATGILYDREIKFREKGFLSSQTDITEVSQNETIGSIRFNGWRTKATLLVEGREYSWKYDNFWGTRWSIYDQDQLLIRYKSSAFGGEIETNLDKGLLILIGLFVHNYYVKITVVTAVMVAIISSSS